MHTYIGMMMIMMSFVNIFSQGRKKREMISSSS